MRRIEITAGSETYTGPVETIKQLTDAVQAYAEPYTADKAALWGAFSPIALRYETPRLYEEPGLRVEITES